MSEVIKSAELTFRDAHRGTINNRLSEPQNRT